MKEKQSMLCPPTLFIVFDLRSLGVGNSFSEDESFSEGGKYER
jgi:hypothetical protein